MYLPLPTMDIWSLEDEFTPTAFLRALRHLLQADDVIAFGAYSPSARLLASPLAVHAATVDAGKIYHTSFDFNRREHPHGRSFEVSASDSTLQALIAEAQREDGQDDKPLFFDHLVAYRRGVPVVPLLSFHDAFFGGTLAVSDLYSEATVREFAAALPSTYARKRNPENYPDVT
jgi:hypothetical protein